MDVMRDNFEAWALPTQKPDVPQNGLQNQEPLGEHD
jgi:hypothetical protein